MPTSVFVLVVIIGVIMSVYTIIKSLGNFEYDTEEKRKEYDDWMENKSFYERIRAIALLIFYIFCFILVVIM